MDVFGNTLEGERNKLISYLVVTINTLEENIVKITEWMKIQENKITDWMGIQENKLTEWVEIQESKLIALNKKSDEIVIKIKNIEAPIKIPSP